MTSQLGELLSVALSNARDNRLEDDSTSDAPVSIGIRLIHLDEQGRNDSFVKDNERLVILNLLSRKRQTKAPFRRFTILSARALAAFLASGENAERKLCPHAPVKDTAPDDCAFPMDSSTDSVFMRQIATAHGRNLHDGLEAASGLSSSASAELSMYQIGRDADVPLLEAGAEMTPELSSYFDKPYGRPQRMLQQKRTRVRGAKKDSGKGKDAKSFVQNVFDTEFFKASKLVKAEYGGYRLLPNGKSPGTNGNGRVAKIQRDRRFCCLVEAELFTHPIFSVAWKDLGAVFLLDRSMWRKSDIDHLQDSAAADIIQNALFALNAHLPSLHPDMRMIVWNHFIQLRKYGLFAPGGKVEKYLVGPILQLMDSYEDEMALRLVTRLVHAFASRRCWSEASGYSVVETEERPGKGPQFHDFVKCIMQGISRGIQWLEHPKSKERPDVVPYSYAADRTVDLNGNEGGVHYAATVLEWLRSIIIHEWDGQAEIQRFGTVGGTIDFMSCLYEWRHDLGLSADAFCTPFLADRLDSMDLPIEWLSRKVSKNTSNLLSFPFLFTPATLVTYFRAINYASMAKAFEVAWATFNLYQRMQHIARDERIQHRLKAATNSYFVLEIRRDNILPDALDQLWRRQRRELVRPLKVRMGMDEGEEGVDHGGVQQEFFRVALGEALNPDYGLFTTDSQTQMSWFRPLSLEGSYKFELLGLLTSLAVYNGLTLPVTFPLALYRKLLGMPVTDLSHIQDGWPDLSRGLAELLSWSDGDVVDVFMRSYVFSVEKVGGGGVVHMNMEREGAASSIEVEKEEEQEGNVKHVNVLRDMDEAPNTSNVWQSLIKSSPHISQDGSDDWVSLHNSDAPLSDSDVTHGSRQSEKTTDVLRHHLVDPQIDDASMVTNENRNQYVADYIYWLTDKSIQSEYEAFARGFYACLDKKALSIFSPEALQNVVEGNQTIDVEELEKHTKYENGYSPQHPAIKDFWFVVRSFSEDELRRLLEFVTASDRVPVKGVASMTFTIQRNGTNDERLPTSLTCFGRLLLPEYSSREKLQERLGLAIANSQGFGVA